MGKHLAPLMTPDAGMQPLGNCFLNRPTRTDSPPGTHNKCLQLQPLGAALLCISVFFQSSCTVHSHTSASCSPGPWVQAFIGTAEMTVDSALPPVLLEPSPLCHAPPAQGVRLPASHFSLSEVQPSARKAWFLLKFLQMEVKSSSSFSEPLTPGLPLLLRPSAEPLAAVALKHSEGG